MARRTRRTATRRRRGFRSTSRRRAAPRVSRRRRSAPQRTVKLVIQQAPAPAPVATHPQAHLDTPMVVGQKRRARF